MAGVLVIIPVVDEASNIERCLRAVRAVDVHADILVVDGASSDGTADFAEKVSEDLGRIQVLRQPTRNGLGGAYRDGFAAGLEQGYEVLVEMDADLSHDPADLPVLLEAIAGGADLAIGSRYVPGGSTPNWPRRRRWLSMAGNRYVQFALRMPVHDATAGYRAYTAEALRSIDVTATRADGYAFQVEMAYRVARNGGRIVERPIAFSDRTGGRSKMSNRIVVEAMALVTAWAVRDRLLRRR